MLQREFKVGDTAYYTTLNNRVGKGVIKRIENGEAALAYEIKTKFMSQRRTINKPVGELFPTAAICETHIKGNGGMGTPTTKICRQFYQIGLNR